jgi:hypothetical protein
MERIIGHELQKNTCLAHPAYALCRSVSLAEQFRRSRRRRPLKGGSEKRKKGTTVPRLRGNTDNPKIEALADEVTFKHLDEPP